jgi:hypothetical protein
LGGRSGLDGGAAAREDGLLPVVKSQRPLQELRMRLARLGAGVAIALIVSCSLLILGSLVGLYCGLAWE